MRIAPYGGRGLKLHVKPPHSYIPRIAPYGGRGLKPVDINPLRCPPPYRPLRGAWIETPSPAIVVGG